jgi:pimeloyl-ACP methyl ester carboxylesterase
MSTNRGGNLMLVIALLLVFGGAWLASAVQRAGGDVDVREVRFAGSGGTIMSGALYIPQSAGTDSPAPAVLAIHGYINTREMQAPYAIELARRGYVVLALDQTGHGYSDPPAFANGFGGPDGLRYLRTLDFVDHDQIVLSGHSMGGWASLVAAGVFPDDYRAIVVSGSSTGTFGAPDGSAAFPRNFALVWGRYDEFSWLMWGAPTGADVVYTEKLQAVFGTGDPVQPNRLYGSLEDGTARQLYMPAQTHPANHITASGVAGVVDWAQTTTRAPRPLPPADQIWQWKELGTLMSLVGGILFLLAFGSLLLRGGYFGPLSAPLPAAHGMTGPAWWAGAGVFVVLPAATYFPLQAVAAAIAPNAVLSQSITTGIMVWAAGTGVLSFGLLLLWHYFSGRHRGATGVSYGLTRPGTAALLPTLLRASLFGIAIVAAAHLLLSITESVFGTDFRFWLVAVKPLDALRLGIFTAYVLPFVLFFIVIGTILHGQLRGPDSTTLPGAMTKSVILMGLGMAILLAIQYVPLLAGNPMPLRGTPWTLLTIVAIQFGIMLPVLGLISAYFFHKTAQVYPGAVVNGLFITWMIVSTQAIHYPF